MLVHSEEAFKPNHTLQSPNHMYLCIHSPTEKYYLILPIVHAPANRYTEQLVMDYREKEYIIIQSWLSIYL